MEFVPCCVSVIRAFCFQNLLRLNPRIKPHASLVASAVTKKNKKNWKRNQDKSCGVRFVMMTSWQGKGFRITESFVRVIHRSPVDFPHEVSVMWCCGVFFVVSLNKLSDKQSSRWLFNTSWRSCDSCDVLIGNHLKSDVSSQKKIWWCCLFFSAMMEAMHDYIR